MTNMLTYLRVTITKWSRDNSVLKTAVHRTKPWQTIPVERVHNPSMSWEIMSFICLRMWLRTSRDGTTRQKFCWINFPHISAQWLIYWNKHPNCVRQVFQLKMKHYHQKPNSSLHSSICNVVYALHINICYDNPRSWTDLKTIPFIPTLSFPYFLPSPFLTCFAILPTSFGGKGSHLRRSDDPNWGFLWFSSAVRQMPGDLCTTHRSFHYHPYN